MFLKITFHPCGGFYVHLCFLERIFFKYVCNFISLPSATIYKILLCSHVTGFVPGEPNPTEPHRLCSWNRHGHSEVSLWSSGQLDRCVGGKGKPRRPSRPVLRDKCGIYQSRHGYLPHGPVQLYDRQEGVQFQEDTQVRLQVAGQ